MRYQRLGQIVLLIEGAQQGTPPAGKRKLHCWGSFWGIPFPHVAMEDDSVPLARFYVASYDTGRCACMNHFAVARPLPNSVGSVSLPKGQDVWSAHPVPDEASMFIETSASSGTPPWMPLHCQVFESVTTNSRLFGRDLDFLSLDAQHEGRAVPCLYPRGLADVCPRPSKYVYRNPCFVWDTLGLEGLRSPLCVFWSGFLMLPPIC